MKITAVITDADIRYYIDQAATELEEDNQIRFPDSDARAEFIEDCVSSEIDKYELYERDPFGYRPDYRVEVLDMADLYEYTVADLKRDWTQFRMEDPDNHAASFQIELFEILMATINGRNDLEITGMTPREISNITLRLRAQL